MSYLNTNKTKEIESEVLKRELEKTTKQRTNLVRHINTLHKTNFVLGIGIIIFAITSIWTGFHFVPVNLTATFAIIYIGTLRIVRTKLRQFKTINKEYEHLKQEWLADFTKTITDAVKDINIQIKEPIVDFSLGDLHLPPTTYGRIKTAFIKIDEANNLPLNEANYEKYMEALKHIDSIFDDYEEVFTAEQIAKMGKFEDKIKAYEAEKLNVPSINGKDDEPTVSDEIQELNARKNIATEFPNTFDSFMDGIKEFNDLKAVTSEDYGYACILLKKSYIYASQIMKHDENHDEFTKFEKKLKACEQQLPNRNNGNDLDEKEGHKTV